jgi:UDP-N-acetylglucosamine 2-epimerase (non-hydrolysing)
LIICFIGTRAQVIKMAPILYEMEQSNVPFRLILTGQHEETIDQLLVEFGIQTPPRKLHQGKEISGIVQMGGWFIRCLWLCLIESKTLFSPSIQTDNAILVHGDTISTLLGAIIGKILGFRIVHIEAGLRSHNLFHPFPEELTRLAVFRLSTISFCPGQWAFNNLSGYRTERIDTGHNTLIDALAIALQKASSMEPIHSLENYGVVSIHRFENIFSISRLTKIIQLIEKAAESYPLIFVLHPSTRKKIVEYNLLERIEKNTQIKVVARMGYIHFVGLMRNSSFVISDGGGNQEELSYLGVPTLLMRKATERQEGLNQTATLCCYEESKLVLFLNQLSSVRPPISRSSPSPTRIIVNRLADFASAHQ